MFGSFDRLCNPDKITRATKCRHTMNDLAICCPWVSLVIIVDLTFSGHRASVCPVTFGPTEGRVQGVMGSWLQYPTDELHEMVRESFQRMQREQVQRRDAMLKLEDSIKERQQCQGPQGQKRHRASSGQKAEVPRKTTPPSSQRAPEQKKGEVPRKTTPPSSQRAPQGKKGEVPRKTTPPSSQRAPQQKKGEVLRKTTPPSSQSQRALRVKTDPSSRQSQLPEAALVLCSSSEPEDCKGQAKRARVKKEPKSQSVSVGPETALVPTESKKSGGRHAPGSRPHAYKARIFGSTYAFQACGACFPFTSSFPAHVWLRKEYKAVQKYENMRSFMDVPELALLISLPVFILSSRNFCASQPDSAQTLRISCAESSPSRRSRVKTR